MEWSDYSAWEIKMKEDEEHTLGTLKLQMKLFSKAGVGKSER